MKILLAIVLAVLTVGLTATPAATAVASASAVTATTTATVTAAGTCKTYWAHAFPHSNYGLGQTKTYIERHFGCVGVTQKLYKDRRGRYVLRKYYLGPTNSRYRYDYRVVWYDYRVYDRRWTAVWVKAIR